MSVIIITTREELLEIMSEVFEKHHNHQPVISKVEPTRLNLSEALAFLNTEGFPISISRMNKLTASKLIPHSKFNRKLGFCKVKLLEWAQTHTQENTTNNMSLVAIAHSARNRKG